MPSKKAKRRPGWWRKDRGYDDGQPMEGFLMIEGKRYSLNNVNDNHRNALVDDFGKLLELGVVKLEGRSVSEALEAWHQTDLGTAHLIRLVVADEYRAHTGRELELAAVTAAVKEAREKAAAKIDARKYVGRLQKKWLAK